MLIFKTIGELTDYLTVRGETDLGFVPTMGALHDGHGSLVRYSVTQHACTICSIYVNPAQFNDAKDYTAYPKTPERDLDLLKSWGCNLVLMPETTLDLNDIKPFNDFDNLNSILEAPDRPGHFEGVCKIVEYLLLSIKPIKAYFGKKDYQQIAVIRRLIEIRKLNVELIECPTCREPSGLAMSSRNRRLNAQGLILAAQIPKLILQAYSQVKPLGYTETERVIKQMCDDLNITLHYAEFRCQSNLNRVTTHTPISETIFLIACTIQGVRLIDNMTANEAIAK